MKKLFKWYYKFRIGVLHAAFHRNMKHADTARTNRDLIQFKKYIYRAEDAWRKLVILTEKIK